MKLETSQEKRADFAALCAWIIGSGTMALIAFDRYGQDFRGYYAAARVLLEGGNPYDYSQVAAVLLQVTGRAGNNPFYYPLWFGWFITSLAWLPFQISRAIWMIFNWTAWTVGLIRLQQLIRWPPRGWRNWLMNLLTTFIFAWMTWKFEQAGILLFAVMVEVLIAYRKQQWDRMGFFLALSLLKPNVMFLPIVTLAAWLIRQKNWRPVLTMLGILTGLVLITTIMTPDWYQPVFRPGFGQGLTNVLDGPDHITGIRLNTTLLDWLGLFSIPRGVGITIYIAGTILGLSILVITVQRSKTILQTTVTSLLVTFAITPYALQYDYPPLAIVLFWAIGRAYYAAWKVVPVLLISFIGSVLLWERPISEGFWIVFGLAVLAIWTWQATKNHDVPLDLS